MSNLVYDVTVFFQQGGGFLGRVFLIKLDSQHAFLEFPVVDDADVLDADVVACQYRGNRGNSPGLVDNVAV